MHLICKFSNFFPTTQISRKKITHSPLLFHFLQKSRTATKRINRISEISNKIICFKNILFASSVYVLQLLE